MKTPYGELKVGDVYVPADGSDYKVTVVDVETFAEQEDAVILCPNGSKRKIDWFKLMEVRYKKEKK